MDASSYAKSADKIRQISLHIEGKTFPSNPGGKQAVLLLLSRLDDALRSIDHCAWLEEKGLL